MSKQRAYDNIQFVKNWFQDRRTSNVNLIEDVGFSDPAYESNILREVRFEPQSPYGLRIDLWFADDGSIGFGIDRRDRVAKLIGVKARSNRFVGGREPFHMSLNILHLVLNLVADGKVSISLLHFPILGLISTKLLLGENEYKSLEDLGFSGMSDYFSKKIYPFAQIVNFERWT